MKNIVAVDDHSLFLAGLQSLIERYPAWYWEAGYSDPQEFLDDLDELAIDVLLLDISMPGINGFQLLDILTGRGCRFPVVFLTGFKHPLLIARVQNSGAKACMHKDDSFEDLRDTLDAVQRGGPFYLSHSLDAIADPSVRSLSPREFEILGLIANGALNKQIAAELNISVGTVITHRKRIKDKTGALNAADLAKLASEIGVI